MADDDKTLGMLCHLLAIFTGFLGPLVLWLVKKGSSPTVDAHGRAVLNFQFTFLIAFFVSVIVGVVLGIIVPTLFIVFGILWFLLGVAVLVLLLMGTLKAAKGDLYEYPFAIAFLK